MELIDWRTVKGLSQSGWESRLGRPVADTFSLESTVGPILNEIKEKGDEAVRRFSLMFDKVKLENLEVGEAEIKEAASKIPENLKHAIDQARINIEIFHRSQVQIPESIETMPGLRCWSRNSPIEKVGLYIPGGTAPLFSTLLMLGVPASIAGCREIVVCSPPDTAGLLHPAILYTAKLVGVTRILRIGGVQAIAAMAYGTETIPKLYKIFGPGNQYVMCAKQLVQKDGVAIDMPAGPSELAVYADNSANPVFLAADLLSQAEHGVDSQVLLVCLSVTTAERVLEQIKTQLDKLPRKQIAGRALENSKIIVVENDEEAMVLLNEYAPEHLILACENAGELSNKIRNAGSVFLGHYSPESVGDYASGTNHVLPTNGHAKAFGGLSVSSFQKRITFQELTTQALVNVGPAVELLAAAEGLLGHANSVSVRLKDISTSRKVLK
jgi:histidinol dehydrogenase